MQRLLIEINEEKCNGCGQCVLDCAEGALAVVNGKARLVSEVFCDGLGACLNCPQGALALSMREAPAFDEQAALAAKARRENAGLPGTDFPLAARNVSGAENSSSGDAADENKPLRGCAGSAARVLKPLRDLSAPGCDANGDQNADLRASLPSWPIQLCLASPGASFLREARLLLAAHCAGFALPHLHRDWLHGRVPLIACPKLENYQTLLEKLTAIVCQARPLELTVLRMSVPCCGGLERLAAQAVEAAGAAGYGLRPENHLVRLG